VSGLQRIPYLKKSSAYGSAITHILYVNQHSLILFQHDESHSWLNA